MRGISVATSVSAAGGAETFIGRSGSGRGSSGLLAGRRIRLRDGVLGSLWDITAGLLALEPIAMMVQGKDSTPPHSRTDTMRRCRPQSNSPPSDCPRIWKLQNASRLEQSFRSFHPDVIPTVIFPRVRSFLVSFLLLSLQLQLPTVRKLSIFASRHFVCAVQKQVAWVRYMTLLLSAALIVLCQRTTL
jgi:hypothetical protein